MKKFRVGVDGIGVVGAEMIKVIRHRKFPAEEIRVLARRERNEIIAGQTYHVLPASLAAFKGLDFAFFAGTEGARGASQQWGWEAVKQGAIVIDNGDDYRMDPRVPLVIPEINPQALKKHQGFVANPNCSTIIALMVLAPLHRIARIRRFVVSTYQAVSGTGRNAVLELEEQIKQYAAGQLLTASVYPHQIALNVIPKIGSVNADMHDFTSEEIKMRNETHKILEDKTIKICATCVRVPVFYGHCEAINVEFDRKLSVADALQTLSEAQGITVTDDIENDKYPLPIDASGKDDVFVGRIRKDESAKNGISLFVSGDNIRKGAALNAVQIAEKIISAN